MITTASHLRKKVIGVFGTRFRNSMEGFAFFLSWNGAARVIIGTDLNAGLGDHSGSVERMRAYPGLEVVPYDSTPTKLDHLFIALQGHRPLWNKHLNRWLRAASKVGGLTEETYSGGWRPAAREVIRCLPYSVFLQSVGFEAPRSSHNPYFWVQNRFFLTPPPHPQFLANQELRSLMYGPLTGEPRPFRLQFVGSNTPEERLQVLKTIRRVLESCGAKFTANPTHISANVLWIEYGGVDSSGPRGLSPHNYVRALDQSVFAICPLGWGGLWTHRAIESILRGAIPILPEWSRYNIGFRPNENCIGVSYGQWEPALRHAWNLPPAHVAKMQAAVLTLRETLSLNCQSRRIHDAIADFGNSASGSTPPPNKMPLGNVLA